MKSQKVPTYLVVTFPRKEEEAVIYQYTLKKSEVS